MMYKICQRLKSVVIVFVVGAFYGSSTESLRAQDSELTNYKSGIDLVWLGQKGVDYQEEYLYFDKLVSDRKIVYIRSSTQIAMAHNERNRAGRTDGKDAYQSVGTDVGKIRYKIDGDQRWEIYPTSYTEYIEPISFSSLNYGMYGDSTLRVLGSSGDNGVPLDLDTKTSRYHRGIIGPSGNEFHTITVADDDSAHTSNPEYRSSDGKVILFVVDPKTPALTVRTTGTGQFYTTPAKKYFVPKIYAQTTYIDSGNSGTVTFEINDIFGNNVYYRINGGSFIQSSESKVILGDFDFRTGSNTLEYYYEGNEAHVKLRKVVKNPDYPSRDEAHGNRLWVNSENWENEIRSSLLSDTDKNWWYKQWKTTDTYGKRSQISAWARNGGRNVFDNAAFPNALVAKVDGFNSTPSNDSTTFAQYAKLALFECAASIDPVGAELNTEGKPIPAREIIYRGYYDINTIIDAAAAYDVLIGGYRRDQGFSSGITPIEDYYIRDTLASWTAFSILFDTAGYEALQWDTRNKGGMWDTARKVSALMIACMMPSYSTEYYGTSGLDGNTTTYLWAPYRDVGYTWKQILIDNDLPITGFPNVHKRLGIEDYLISDDGHFIDRRGYTAAELMGHVFGIYANLIKLFAPEKETPKLDLMRKRAAEGTLQGLKISRESDRGNTFRAFAVWLNAWFPDTREIGKATMQTKDESHQESKDKQLFKGGPLYVIWYDHDLPIPSVENIETIANAPVKVGETKTLKYSTNSSMQSIQIDQKTANTTFHFTAIPSSIQDTLIGFGNKEASVFQDMACIVRFNSEGFIDAFNSRRQPKAWYDSVNQLPYVANISYTFNIHVNFEYSTYSVWVESEVNGRTLVAENFGFREPNEGLQEINHLSYITVNSNGQTEISDLIMNSLMRPTDLKLSQSNR